MKFNMKCNTDNLPVPNAKKIKLDLTQSDCTKHGECYQPPNHTTKDNSHRCLLQEQNHLRAILNDKYFRALETVQVYTCQINNIKETSTILREINEVYNLGELKHLKRVRNDDGKLKVLITFVQKNAPNNAATLKELFSGTSVDTKGLSEPSVEVVPKYPPLTRQQFEECSKIWPTGFHENKYITRLINGEIFDEMELQEMRGYMKQAMDVAVVAKNKGMVPVGAVMVNPKTKEMLCKAHDMSSKHPLQHTAMICIDHVGKLQGGGAWDMREYFREKEHFEISKGNSGDCSMLDEKYCGSCLKNNNGTEQVTTEHNCCEEKAKEDGPSGTSFSRNQSQGGRTGSETKSSPLTSACDLDVPYLCTGYDLYITREPCVMCSMALLHSRIRRVFYAQDFPSFGGLGSKYKIHCLEETNHHFEVFSGLLESECRQILS